MPDSVIPVPRSSIRQALASAAAVLVLTIAIVPVGCSSESEPTNPAPTRNESPDPVEPAAVDPDADAPTPVVPAPVESEPVQPAPSNPAPVQPAPSNPAPAEPVVEDPAAAPGGVQQRQADALRVLNEMVEAYANLPMLDDEVEVESLMGAQPQPLQEIQIRLGAGNDAQIILPTTTMTCVDDRVYLAVAQQPARYASLPVESDPVTALRNLGVVLPALQLQLRCRHRRPANEIIESIAIGLTQDIRISSYRVIEDRDGDKFEQVTFTSATGSGFINIDPVTKLARYIETQRTPRNAPVGNVKFISRAMFHPKIVDTLDPPIALTFDPTKRQRFDTIAGLTTVIAPGEELELKVAKGDVAPAIDAAAGDTFEGTPFSLAEQRGKAVALVFMGVTNPESRRMMTSMLDAYDAVRAASDAGAPVEIALINTLEAASKGEMFETVFEVWEEITRFPQVILDWDEKFANRYGVIKLPVTVVVGPDGRVSEVMTGIKPTYPADLDAALDRANDNARGGG